MSNQIFHWILIWLWVTLCNISKCKVAKAAADRRGSSCWPPPSSGHHTRARGRGRRPSRWLSSPAHYFSHSYKLSSLSSLSIFDVVHYICDEYVRYVRRADRLQHKLPLDLRSLTIYMYVKICIFVKLMKNIVIYHRLKRCRKYIS